MICPKCNYEFEGTPKFCPECGEKLAVEPKPEPVVEAAEKTAGEIVEEKPVKPSFFKRIPKAVKISVAAVLAAGIIFGLLFLINPGCMFGHRFWPNGRKIQVVIKSPTCSAYGESADMCMNCGNPVPETRRLINKLEHEYGKIECGAPAACLNCNAVTTFNHEWDDTVLGCKYCKISSIDVTIDDSSVYVTEYSSGYRAGTIDVSVQAYNTYEGVVSIHYSILRYSCSDGSRAKASFEWLLYDTEGNLVRSGVEITDYSVKEGEFEYGEFQIYGLDPWSEYVLEISDTTSTYQ